MSLSQSYEDWKHCITVKCGIPLTADYIAKRVAALRNLQDPMTKRFVTLYGEAYRGRVIGWFEQARQEVAG